MKQFVKFICLILSFTLLLSIPAQAAEVPTPRASDYFVSSAVYLYETTGTSFQAWFDVTCKRTMDKVGAKEIKIQRSTDNENWTTVATFSMDDYYSTLIRENRGTHVGYVNYTGTRGYYYRAFYRLHAEDETGTATWSRYSSSIYID